MKLLRFYISVLLLFLSYSNTFAQSAIDQTLTKLQKHTEEQPFEKAYLHLDKPYYAAGDTIWLAGYTVIGAEHTPSNLSGVLNIELINSRNNITQSIKLPIISGLSYGDLVLPDTITQGSYHIRAYTNWMRNMGSDYFFNQPLQIVNTITGLENKAVNKEIKTTIPSKTDVQFFPEGGYLINGVGTKIAFKATSSNGLSKYIKGSIIDNKGNTVTDFESTHLGMGSFRFAPQSGSTYFASINISDVSPITIPLPKAIDKGYLLNVNNADAANIAVKITAVNISDGFTLIAQSGGDVFLKANGSAGKILSQVNIDKSKLPTGIIKFTLFSASGEPMNERLVFIQNPDKLNLAIKSNQQTYQPRQKVKVDLNVKDAGGLAANGNFSVTVINETGVPVDENAETTILTHLLLTSDLKGYIERPNYYFSTTPQSQADLDLLMLTQGYSRYEWKKIINNESSALQYQPEKNLSISGTVTKGRKPYSNGPLFLVAPSPIAMRDTVTDINGSFNFNNLYFNDNTNFTIKAGEKDDLNIRLNNSAPAAINAVNLYNVQADTTINTYAKISKKVYEQEVKFGIRGKLLGEVTIKETRGNTSKEMEIEKAMQYSANLNGKGRANQVFTTKDIEEFQGKDLFKSLESKLRGITFENDKAYLSRVPSWLGKKYPMGIIIDGMYVGDDITLVPPVANVAGVEVLSSLSRLTIYGSIGSSGLILITSKQGGQFFNKLTDVPGVIKFNVKGYYNAHEFYSPVYTVADNKSTDLRTTIFWEPLLATDKDGNTSFEYFNADSKGNYRVVVEGMDNNGNLGRQVFRYKVE